VGALIMRSEVDMLKYRNFGKKSLNEIKEKLESLGLCLGYKFDRELLDKEVDTE
jgi:DNA-directed RNA polymerase subunit alpha